MSRLARIAVAVVCGCAALGTSAAGQLAPGPAPSVSEDERCPREWVELLDGRRYEGYIESEDDLWVHLVQIRRPPGRPMHLVIRPIEREAVAKVVRLDASRRAELRRRVEQFIQRSRIEAARMEAVRLDKKDGAGERRYHYDGKWFTLESHTDELFTRRIIVRLEQIFTAYRQILPPRTTSEEPPRLVIFGTVEEYRSRLAEMGIHIDSPACFVPAENLVLAGSELARFAAQLVEVKARHGRLRSELERLEKQLASRLAEIAEQLRKRGAPREEISKLMRKERRKFEYQMEEIRRELERSDRENARKFDDLTQQMFARLYHEAFHAYLENHVFPSRTHDVPRWLNEGLAVMFAQGILESDTLRIDAPNGDALKRLQADLRGEGPLSLAALLRAGPRAFLADERANRYYSYSWGMAYYLAFEKRLLYDSALDRYVRPASSDAPPVRRFEELVGMPLAEFEKGWRAYILTLR